VGNIPMLGEWNTKKALRLKCKEKRFWKCELNFKKEEWEEIKPKLEWKFLYGNYDNP